MTTSPVPDLIYEDQQRQRVDEIAALLEHPETIEHAQPLHRVTVFVTYGCNLACPYCKTIVRDRAELETHPQRRQVHSLASITTLLDVHAGTPIHHLHITGGEATMLAELPQMIALAKARGVARVSTTSNGQAQPDFYRALIAAGIDEIRISLDANDRELARSLTLRPRAFDRAVATLAALADARRAGAPVFLIINTVVGIANRERLPALVRFLLELAPDDVKLITEVDERDTLSDFAGSPEVRAELAALLATRAPNELPLLRKKLATVFATDAIGLETVPPRTDWRCYIPLTERTVDAVHYYPCSVYLREGGAPLGSLDDPPATQRANTAAFVRDGNCLEDPICRRYCLACTKQFNVRANDRR